jgi:hypothetical protein
MSTIKEMSHPIEDCYGSRLHCWWHNIDETETDISRTCFECNHVYKTADDLANAWKSEMGIVWNGPEPIPACAYCGHDW